ncbi:F178B protein, partial [Upupa epops]|nr:F178B protein [Upupa epops]
RWYQVPLSSARIPRSNLFSFPFQSQLQRYQKLRARKRLPVGRPVPSPPPGLFAPWPPAPSPDPPVSHEQQGAGEGRGESPEEHPAGTAWGWVSPVSSEDKELSPLGQEERSLSPEAPQHIDANPKRGQRASTRVRRGTRVPTRPPRKRCRHPRAQTKHPRPDPLANSLESLLQEKREWSQAVALQTRLALALADDPSPCQSSDEGTPLSQEQRDFVAPFSLNLQSIPTLHPGEAVFCAHPAPAPTLDARGLQPQSPLERTFLRNSPTLQTALVRDGALSLLYRSVPNCPLPVLRWLFQLAALCPDATNAAQALWDIWLRREQPWCPTVLEISKAFALLGADLSPLRHLLSPKKCPVRRSAQDPSRLAQAASPDPPGTLALVRQLAAICEFLALCVVAQPCHYTDCARLALVNILSLLSLDRALRCQPLPEVQHLLCCLLEGIQDWQEQGAPMPPEPSCHGLAAAGAGGHRATPWGTHGAGGAEPAPGAGTAGRRASGTHQAPRGAGRCQPGDLLLQPQPPPPR